MRRVSEHELSEHELSERRVSEHELSECALSEKLQASKALRGRARGEAFPKTQIYRGEAPANLALIKYMGKKGKKGEKGKKKKEDLFPSNSFLKDFLKGRAPVGNQPLNSSFSLTLPHLKVQVEISPLLHASSARKASHHAPHHAAEDIYAPLSLKAPPSKNIVFFAKPGGEGLCDLSPAAQKRFLDFFKFLKAVFQIQGFYKVRSGGNFPHSIGMASSSAAFAALSKAVFSLARARSPVKSLAQKLSLNDLALLSAYGSGSSARSFFAPAALWRGKNIQAAPLPFGGLLHEALIVERRAKTVSSSAAHQRVLSSPLFKGRPQRAERRLRRLLAVMEKGDWPACRRIIREEFCDMHRLFETGSPPFSYKSSRSEKILKTADRFWRENKDGPWVTMDAGSVIHFLWRPDQSALRARLMQELGKY